MAGITLPPIKPHYATGLMYGIKLNTLFALMIDDVTKGVLELYQQQEHRIIFDATPSDILANWLNKRLRKWSSIFAKLIPNIVVSFVNDVDDNIKRDLTNGITKELTNLNVQPKIIKSFAVKMSEDSKRALNAQQGLIKNNVALITNISDDTRKKIFNDVMEASMQGRNLQYLTEKLRALNQFPEKRIKLIARDQINKATGAINTARQLDLGIKKNTWRHSHGDKEPRPDHLAADGRIYNLDEGCPISGEYIYPGQKIKCTCFSQAYLPYLEFLGE